jgi:hypothetical protein
MVTVSSVEEEVDGGDTVLCSTNLAALDSEKITKGAASNNSSNNGKD